MHNYEGTVFRILAEELIARRAQFLFVATGRSMSPFIRDGSSVIIRPCSSKVRVGDVLLLKQDDEKLLLHRVVKKTGAELITRGDACAGYDSPFRKNDIIGKAAGGSGGFFSLHLIYPFSYFLVICLYFIKHPLLLHPVQEMRKRIFQLNAVSDILKKKQKRKIV